LSSNYLLLFWRLLVFRFGNVLVFSS
jgi:hypothetical protein